MELIVRALCTTLAKKKKVNMFTYMPYETVEKGCIGFAKGSESDR